MHGLTVILIDPPKFSRRFRLDRGWVYDWRTGRGVGRPVSEKEMNLAIQEFAALYQKQDRLVNVAAKVVFPVVLTVPIFVSALGFWAIAVALLVFGILTMLAAIALANWRIFAFAGSFWNQVSSRPEARLLSVEEQVRLGYRATWTEHLVFWFGLTLILPAYAYGHGRHDILTLIPRFGSAASHWYWLAVKCLSLVGLLTVVGLAVRRIVLALRKRRSPPVKQVEGQGKALVSLIRLPERADLSGVEKAKLR